jgi:OOP family OmpA-OmpF porin
MKLVNRVFGLVAVMLLAGCWSGSPLDMANRAQPVGSPYTKYLAQQYLTLANSLSGSQANYFAKKSLAATDGMIVAPESLQGRDLSVADAADLAESRGALMTALENGGRDRAPDLSAVAQTRFDCWATLQVQHFMKREEEPTFPGETVSCKDQFHVALASLNEALNVAPPPVLPPPAAQPPVDEFPAPVTAAPKGAEAPLRELSFLVFFDWDKYNVSASASDVLETVAHEIKNRNDIKKINIGGYTDTSGGEKYNMKLSIKRADAVRAMLISQGIPANKIHTLGHGKSDLLVKTRDGVREPQNRRAQITFE